MSEKPDLYEFKMALFDNGELEKFFLFIRNFQMTLEVLITLADSEKINYLCMQLCGKTSLQLDTLSVEVISTTIEHLNHIILSLDTYFFPINVLSKQNFAMRRGIRNPWKLKVRRLAARMIEINEYLDAFSEAKASEKVVIRNRMKLFWKVCQISGSDKSMDRFLIVNVLL